MANNKKNIVIIIAIAIIVLLAVLFMVLLGREDSYRIIKVYELEGVATVKRPDAGELEPYNNMILESGDNVYLDSGNMTLKMDEDKYAYVEEKTEFAVRAEGNSENSKTTITINKGAITHEIQNKLNSDASYEVNTPNSTMAVRGTVFRVSTYYDEAGVCYTKVSVFEGEVTSRLVYPDGTVSDEEVSVSAGKEVIIYEDDKTTDYLTEVTDIDYSNLPENVIILLENMLGIQINTTSTEASTEKEQNTEEMQNEFVVTFIYKDTTFATQVVTEGELATIPTLMPAATGDWDFDFTTPVTEDISIQWKE